MPAMTNNTAALKLKDDAFILLSPRFGHYTAEDFGYVPFAALA
jgi:hypothetical protein